MVPFLSGNQNSTMWNCAPASDVVLLGGSDSLNSGLVGSEMRGVAIINPPASATDQSATRFRAATGPARPRQLRRRPEPGRRADARVHPPSSRPARARRTCINGGTRLYVNCFDTGEIYVFDSTVPSLVTSFQVGRGPAGMYFDPKLPVAYVLDFSQNDIVVVDLAPGSPTEDHVIQRIGFPTTTPR